MRKRISIKSAWYVLMIAGGLLSLTIMTLIIAPRAYDALLDDALLHNHDINVRIADKLNDEIGRLTTLLENKSDPLAHIVNTRVAGKKSSLKLIDTLFAKVLLREEYVNAITFVRPEGTLIAHADRQNFITSQSDRNTWSWLSEQIRNKSLLHFPVKDKVYIGPILREKPDSKFFNFIMAIPVGDEKQPVAILIIELYSQDLLQNIMGKFIRPDYKTYFVSKSGELLHGHFQEKYNSGGSLKNIEIVNSSLKNNVWNVRQVYRGINGKDVFGTAQSISSVNWKVISEVERDTVLSPIYETIFASFVVVLAVIVLFVWLGVLIARRMIAPIDILTDSFRQAARQDYSPTRIESPLEEFHQLAKGYDAMVSEIKNREQKLHKSKEALEANEEHFRIVTENIHEVLLIISTYWENIIYVSPAYEDIWGFSCESLYKNPQSWADAIHPSDRAQVHLEIIRLALAPLQFSEFRIQSADGEIKWILTKAYPVYNDKAEITSYVYVMHDVTQQHKAQLEQKKLQHQLQQSQKMEAIGQLTGGIAHDFNNMLTSIMGYTSLALDRFGKDIDPKLVEYLSEIDLAGERARDLIRQLLLFSRESNSEPETIALAPLVKEVTKMLRTSFPGNIEIWNEIQPDLPPVLMDPVRLHQLIMNLCINARDAIEGNGSITISSLVVNQHKGDCDACYQIFQGDFVELIIEDTGYGIEPSVMSRIFDPFFTTKELGKGTGMGLSIVHGIVHDLGGHIQVSSGSGGTCFRLFFPVVEKQIKNIEIDHNKVEQAKVGQGQHILIIDDEASVAQFEGELLSHHGYQPMVMTDSEKAITEFLDNPDKYDLVITDQSMPKITGTELAAAMFKVRPDLPVILCTGYINDLNPDEALEIGIREIQIKPIDGRNLIQMVQKHLG